MPQSTVAKGPNKISKTNGANWLDTSLFPFESKFIHLASGQMHYIDEGEGDILLFVHGTPTWSFLYRHLVKELSKEYRCIAIDHIGFGLSEKPTSFDGKPESHSKNLLEFIELLQLEDITMVVHDFGGPIGIGAAIQIEPQIKSMVLFNTWLWETKYNPEVKKVHRMLNSPLGKFLYLKLNFSAKVLLKQGFHDKQKLTKTIHGHYKSPFPNTKSRLGPWNIGKELLGSSQWYQDQWEKLPALATKPWLIIWGDKDRFISMGYLEKWKNRLYNLRTVVVDSGHFVQEERPSEAIAQIKIFMQDIQRLPKDPLDP